MTIVKSQAFTWKMLKSAVNAGGRKSVDKRCSVCGDGRGLPIKRPAKVTDRRTLRIVEVYDRGEVHTEPNFGHFVCRDGVHAARLVRSIGQCDLPGRRQLREPLTLNEPLNKASFVINCRQ